MSLAVSTRISIRLIMFLLIVSDYSVMKTMMYIEK